MPINRHHPIRVLPFFGYRSRERLLISARALRTQESDYSARGSWHALRTMLAHFASHEIAELPVTLNLKSPGGAEHSHEAVTDKEGFVHFDIGLDDWNLPDFPQWETASLHWHYKGRQHRAEGHILTPGMRSNFGIISDIDDTIIETGITGNIRAVLKNWRRVLLQMPEERIAIPGVAAFYNALGGKASVQGETTNLGEGGPATTQHPFFYVSSSPWNLYSYLLAYKTQHGLPLGPIAMRDWGLNRNTFGSSSHGLHKRRAIDRILSTFPEMRFALIGDDTQGDLTAYSSVIADYPGRISAVFIRKAGEPASEEEVAAQAAIRDAGVPLWMGHDYTTSEAFLRSNGLINDEETTDL